MYHSVKYFILLVFIFFLPLEHSSQASKIDTLEKLLPKIRSGEIPNSQGEKLWYEVIKEADLKYNSKDYIVAADLYHRAYFINPENQLLIFNASCSWALANNKENAFKELDIWINSFKNGIAWKDLNSLKTDKDFTNLHDDIRWQKLLNDLEKNLLEKNSSYSWGIFLGILFILFVYNLFLYISIKDISFLYYSLLLLSIIHFEAIRTPAFGGFLAHHLGGLKYILWLSEPFAFLISLTTVFSLLFLNSFLKLKSQLPGIYKSVKYLLIFFSLSAVFLAFFHSRPFAKIHEILIFLTFIFSFIISIISWKKGYKPARFFVLAALILTLSMVMHLLERMGLNIQFKVGVFRPDNIGNIFFFALLSFALGDRINILTKETAEAQQKAMEKLEELVQERTREVVEKSNEIAEKNKDILASIHYAKRIQTSLITSQKYIEKNIARLKKKF